ncbi:hypothetical protein CR970_01650 [Candidatus Saccharibacteria bacterium]|nr:MAG: hypothetical protein CR970_01650 [Candidatus Saccharibacteria bacterium]
MIQFNLLPDVKLEYIRSKRLQHTVLVVSMMVSAAAVALMVVLFMGVVVFQKKHLNDLSRDITQKSEQLRQTPDLDKILTVQSQLGALNGLHDGKPIASRLPDFLTRLTPTNASISSVTMDVPATAISISGSADKLSTVNEFADMLKFTKYRTGESEEPKLAFSDVVVTNFGTQEKGATYLIDCVYDPELFVGTHEVTLQTPEGVTTRSTTEKPSAVFGIQGEQSQQSQQGS